MEREMAVDLRPVAHPEDFRGLEREKRWNLRVDEERESGNIEWEESESIRESRGDR